MDQLMLSIIILNYKTSHLLRLVLKNLLKLEITVSFEIIVVDNASGDGSAEMVERLYPQVTLIKNPKNIGHAQGNNAGIKVAKGKYVVILNSDIIFRQAKDITEIIHYLEQHSDVAILGPKLLNADNTTQISCFRPYSKFTPLYRRTPLGKLAVAKRDLNRHLMSDFDHAETSEVDWLLGAVLFMRKAVLDQCGALDSRFFLYFADYELCDRVKFYGYKVMYYPLVNIVHYHRRESADGSMWGGLGSLLNYTTRVHLKDWFTYLAIKKQGYGSHS